MHAAVVPRVASGSPSRRPSERLREKPIRTGRPRAEQHVEAVDERQVVLDRLAEADARGRGRSAPRESPARRRRPAAPRERRRPRRRRRRSGDRPASCAAHRACASGRGRRPSPRRPRPCSGSPRSAVTSLTSSAPSSSARRATSALLVSIETGAPGQRLQHRDDAAQLLVQARPRRLPDASTRRRCRRSPLPPRACAGPRRSPPRSRS